MEATSERDLPHRLFVYGTLKQGQPNHNFLENSDLGRSKFVACGVTEEPYPLIVATQWNLPFLLFLPGRGKQIRGEIYEIDDEMLKWADNFEGHPDVFSRKLIKVEVVSNTIDPDASESSRREDCWAYFSNDVTPEFLQKETLSDYDAIREKCTLFANGIELDVRDYCNTATY